MTQGCHVDASVTHSPRAPQTKPLYEVVTDRECRDDEEEAKAAMRVIEVIQPGVDTEARWFGARCCVTRAKPKYMPGIFYKLWHTT